MDNAQQNNQSSFGEIGDQRKLKCISLSITGNKDMN